MYFKIKMGPFKTLLEIKLTGDENKSIKSTHVIYKIIS